MHAKARTETQDPVFQTSTSQAGDYSQPALYGAYEVEPKPSVLLEWLHIPKSSGGMVARIGQGAIKFSQTSHACIR
jgi:hypothetical protein